MAQINGIGAIIIHANDPASLARWYQTRLGINTEYFEAGGFFFGEIQDTVAGTQLRIGILPAEEKLADAGHAIMVNYRVDDFEGFLQRLSDNDVAVHDISESEFGKFAYINDPEGNRIEIWAAP